MFGNLLLANSLIMLVQDKLTVYMTKVLEEEKKKWTEGKELPREDGCYTSPLAYDIIQVEQLDKHFNSRVAAVCALLKWIIRKKLCLWRRM